jgi:hypothetical protein
VEKAGGQGGEMAQTMYTHMNKCKNNFKKFLKNYQREKKKILFQKKRRERSGGESRKEEIGFTI